MNGQPMSSWSRRRVGRFLLGAAVLALAGTGFLGFLHTSAGRPLLAWMGVGCPVKRVTPAQAEALRQRGVAAARGAAPAPVRPALGLALDDSREADVKSWAAARGLRCETKLLGLRQLKCSDVPGAALTGTAPSSSSLPVDELMFAFDPDGRLVSVDVLRTRLPAASAARLFAQQTGELTAVLGMAPQRAGDPSAGNLGAGPMRTALATYRFSDYLASVTAMNLPTGVAVREQYQSARTRVQ